MGCVASPTLTSLKYKTNVDFYNDAADWIAYRYNTEMIHIFFFYDETFFFL